MRKISRQIDEKLRSTQQTKAANADPSLDFWISRPTTALTDEAFLERQTLPVDGGGVTRADIAVAHPVPGKGNTRIHIAYIQSGTAHVVTAANKTKMSAHIWADVGFSESASDVAIAYDGTMPKSSSGRDEFKTDREPWVFWVHDGALYARHLNANEPDLTLAESNCTAVTAVRAMWSDVGSFDFGLIVFFLLAGSIYYRQLISGEWTDAAPINFGPAGVTYTDIAAGRTWDYRIALQAKATNGTIYELFTQFAGIGKQNTEHVDLRKVNARGSLTKIGETDTAEQEHVDVFEVHAGALFGGLYSTALPQIRRAQNVPVVEYDEDLQEGVYNWGRQIRVELDVHIDPETITASDWILTDSRNMQFVASKATLQADGLTIALSFADFNNASGECVISYAPGATMTMAGNLAESMSVFFTPENLLPSDLQPPKPVEAWAESPNGTDIHIRFTEPIISGISQAIHDLTVKVPVYSYVPGGVLEDQNRAILDVYTDPEDASVLVLTFGQGNTRSVQNAADKIKVQYSGIVMAGENAFVQPFEILVPIEGLIYKGDQNDAEHVNMSAITATGILTKISSSDIDSHDAGHVSLMGVTASGKLTHIDDI